MMIILDGNGWQWLFFQEIAAYLESWIVILVSALAAASQRPSTATTMTFMVQPQSFGTSPSGFVHRRYTGYTTPNLFGAQKPKFISTIRWVNAHLKVPPSAMAPTMPTWKSAWRRQRGRSTAVGNRLGRASTAVCFLQKNVRSWYVYSMYRLLYTICSLYFIRMLGYIIKCYLQLEVLILGVLSAYVWHVCSTMMCVFTQIASCWEFAIGNHLPHLPQSSRALSLSCARLWGVDVAMDQWEQIGGNGRQLEGMAFGCFWESNDCHLQTPRWPTQKRTNSSTLYHSQSS